MAKETGITKKGKDAEAAGHGLNPTKKGLNPTKKGLNPTKKGAPEVEGHVIARGGTHAKTTGHKH